MLARLAQLLAGGETVALATVIRVLGSVPREVGTKMIIHPEGRHAGTVGGGCGEAAVMRAALEVLSSGQPVIVAADLMGEVSTESAAICGGIMDVFVERLPASGFGAAEIAVAAEAVARNEPLAIATVVAAPSGHSTVAGRKAIIWSSGDVSGQLGLGTVEAKIREDALLAIRGHSLPQLVRYDTKHMPAGEAATTLQQLDLQEQALPVPSHYASGGIWCFVEPQHRPPRLVIVGAGHIAQPLAEMAKLCEFSVTVLDDRSQFANRSRFPSADEVRVGPLTDVLGALSTDRDTYVVLITRGHQHDMECLLQIIDRDLAYIGMIGSRRRVRGVFELLEREHAVSRQLLQRVYAPIGVDIGGTTPAEIAVSIMAEVISVLRGGKVPSLSDSRRKPAAGQHK